LRCSTTELGAQILAPHSPSLAFPATHFCRKGWGLIASLAHGVRAGSVQQGKFSGKAAPCLRVQKGRNVSRQTRLTEQIPTHQTSRTLLRFAEAICGQLQKKQSTVRPYRSARQALFCRSPLVYLQGKTALVPSDDTDDETRHVPKHFQGSPRSRGFPTPLITTHPLLTVQASDDKRHP